MTGNVNEFHESWKPCQKALYCEKHGDWDQAHRIVQEIDSADAAWVHAYLHRKEGDQWNANYWYNRAGRPFCQDELGAEWEKLWNYFSSA